MLVFIFKIKNKLTKLNPCQRPVTRLNQKKVS